MLVFPVDMERALVDGYTVRIIDWLNLVFLSENLVSISGLFNVVVI